MFIDILKCFLIGICASVPLGPIAILVIQKTFSKGHKAGFITGLGATLTDTLYSAIAIYALSFARTFIADYQNYIYLVGGAVVAVIGVSMMMSNPFRRLKTDDESTYSVKDFLQAAVMGISNPGAILVIFGLFAFFGMGPAVENVGWEVAPFVVAVCAGSVSYWYSISLLLSRFRKRIRLRTILWLNRVTGFVVVIIGVFLIGSGVKGFLFP